MKSGRILYSTGTAPGRQSIFSAPMGMFSSEEQWLQHRQQELALLWQQFEESMTDCLRVALVAGEPGIGKTRVLGNVAWQAEQRGALVLHGCASQAKGMPAYLPFLEALGQHVRLAPAATLRAQTGVVASTLATLLPDLPLRLGTPLRSFCIPPEQTRLRLYEAVGDFLAALAHAQPLVLVLDDLQWADPATLDLLVHVVHQHPEAHVFVLGAYREGEIVQRLAFERSLMHLRRVRRLTTLTLGPLTTTEIATLATRLLGAPLDAEARTVLMTQSEGNPFIAEELLLYWRETGTLGGTDARFHLVSACGATLPVSILEAIHQRLSQLSHEVVDVLRTAAIIGRTYESALLAAVTSQDVVAVEEQLQEAVRAHLLRHDRSGTFTFSHGTIHACLFDEMGSAQRARLQVRIAHLAKGEEERRRLSLKAKPLLLLPTQAPLDQAEPGRLGGISARVLRGEAPSLLEQEEPQLAGRARQSRLPAGLSPREAEVLRLVVQGKRNREIAEALVISERTVANHLASIFNKAGVENRAAAVAFALRHELAE